jgi:hypothetical protein
MRIRAMKISMLCALLVALVMAATASAQSPAQTVYNPNGEVLNVVSGGGPKTPSKPTQAVKDTQSTGTPVQQEVGTTPTATSGQLPFTGFQAGLVAVAGLALVGTGFAMRRIARHES